MERSKNTWGDIGDGIDNAFDRRRAQVVAASRYFAGVALREFRLRQAQNEFWTNRTYVARDNVFSDTIKGQGDDVGWFLAHGVEYGVFLEKHGRADDFTRADELKKLKDGRISSALRVIVNALQPRFFERLRQIYAG